MKFSELTKPELDKITENANFTEEEQEIFKLLMANKSLEEIAQRLLLSKATISRRVKNIKSKAERSEDMTTVPIWEKVTLTVEETAEYSNIGINRINDMLKEPGCTFALNVGKGKRLVKRKEFEKYIQKSNEI